MKPIMIFACLTALCSLVLGSSSQLEKPTLSPRTVINSQTAATKLLGDHFFSLQWISWRYYGKASVTENDGDWLISGRQDSRESDDYIKIHGRITEINATDFKFDGEIVTRVSHINSGKPCTRSGEMTFRISGERKYWRLKEMKNPCEDVTDYIDIFFKKYD